MLTRDQVQKFIPPALLARFSDAFIDEAVARVESEFASRLTRPAAGPASVRAETERLFYILASVP